MSQFRGRFLSGPAALVVLLCFFLPWITVSCAGEQLAQFTGYDLALGTMIGLEQIEGDPLFLLVPLAALIALGLIIAGIKLDVSSRIENGGQIAAGLVALAALGYKWFEFGGEADQDLLMGAISIDGAYGLWGTAIGLLAIIAGAVYELIQARDESELVFNNMEYMPGGNTQAMEGGFPSSQVEYPAASAGYPPPEAQQPASPGVSFAGAPAHTANPFAAPAEPGEEHRTPSRPTEVLRQEPQQLAWLIIRDGPRAGHQFRLTEVTNIGRDASNDIVLDDTALSTQHARVKLENEVFLLYDLASTNGTFVRNSANNDWEQIYRQELKDGDQIKFGRIILHFMKLETGQDEGDKGQTEEETGNQT